MSSVSKIMNIIDERKEELGDGVYKELCDKLMELNKEELKSNDLYEIDFVHPKIVRSHEEGREILNVEMYKHTQILKMPRYEANSITSRVNSGNGVITNWSICSRLFGREHADNGYTINLPEVIALCYRDESIDPVTNILTNSLHITAIRKL